MSSGRLKYAVLLLSVLILLFLVFAFGIWMARALRRGRDRLARRPAEPTEYVDAWSMHKVPDERTPDDADDPDDPEKTR